MTIPVLPADFVPLVNSYRVGAPEGVVETQVAGGAPRYALDYDRGVQAFNVSFILSGFQFLVWSAFFHYTLQKGVITFLMPLTSGTGLVAHNCNIVPGSYSAAALGGEIMSIAFTVKAESSIYSLGAANAQALIDVYNALGSAAPTLFARLAKFATVDTLVLQ